MIEFEKQERRNPLQRTHGPGSKLTSRHAPSIIIRSLSSCSAAEDPSRQ
jgi:hypothetical protein